MARMIKKLFSLFLLLAVIALVGLGVFCGVWWMDWPLWVGGYILAGIVGLYLLFKLCRKLYRKHRERRFVNAMAEGDEQRIKTMAGEEKNRAGEMQVKWKQAVGSLRKSHLKTMGNPLYVLPWYMITGRSASGKTTAIKSARLSSPFENAAAVSGISGTRNCEWWFFEKAIVIDTAGRYSVPQDPEGDADEWREFLSLLVKYRKKEPLNGLIITVTAGELQESNRDAQSTYGKIMRNRIDELMRALGSKFPVYVMVTKCDKIQGMTQFCEYLPESSLDQTMGFVNSDFSEDPAGPVMRCFETIGQQLRDLILLILHNPARPIEPDLILLPGEFEALKPGFFSFIQGLLKENPYQETPIFRGIFFTSGRQEGSPYSHFLNRLGSFREGVGSIPETERGLFLHDFFSRLLPSDRTLFTVTQHMVEWRKLTRNLGFAAWAALVISLCGLLSFSFVKNLQVLKGVSMEFKGTQLMQQELLPDLSTLERFSQTIVAVEEMNESWWFPRLWLRESIDLEARLKDKYCALMKSRFLDPFDRQMADRLAYFSLSTPTTDTINHVAHLVKRINLIKARLDQEDLEILKERSQPYYATIETGAGENLIHEIRSKFKTMYLYYLYWKEDTHDIERKMVELQRWLKRILSISGADLNWMVAWADMEPDLHSFTLADFWGLPDRKLKAVVISPGRTLAGKQKIDTFIGEIETALPDPLLIAGQKRDFALWYDALVIRDWDDFMKAFPTGKSLVRTRDEWMRLVDCAHLEKGPYFLFLGTVSEELERFKTREDLPAWLRRIYDFKEVEAQAALVKTQDAADSGLIQKTASRVTSRLRGVGRVASQLKRHFDADAVLEAGKALFDYQQALTNMIPAMASLKTAFSAASAIYTDDPATSEDPFYRGERALASLKRIMGSSREETDAFWSILSGPMDVFHDYIVRQASCRLQQLWEQEVLLEIKDVADQKNINSLLLGSDGYAVSFIKGSAGPFMKRGVRKGFYANSINGKHIPFTRDFLSFISNGIVTAKAVKDSYKLTIEAYPTDVNDDALIKPHATVIELQCSEETTLLENFNYPVKKTLTWSPSEPCSAVFKILIEDLVLKKEFSSPNALPKLLKLFNDGQRKFVPSDFPDEAEALERRNISFISVKYSFSGHAPLLELLRATPGSVPQEVVQCWD